MNAGERAYVSEKRVNVSGKGGRCEWEESKREWPGVRVNVNGCRGMGIVTRGRVGVKIGERIERGKMQRSRGECEWREGERKWRDQERM